MTTGQAGITWECVCRRPFTVPPLSELRGLIETQVQLGRLQVDEQEEDRRSLSCVVSCVATTLYVASLLLPTATFYKPQYGQVFYEGWFALQVGLSAIIGFKPSEYDSWLLAAAGIANPLIWVAIVAGFVGRLRTCRFVALLAGIFCLSVLWEVSPMVIGHPGYWCWLGSALILLLGSCSQRLSLSSQKMHLPGPHPTRVDVKLL